MKKIRIKHDKLLLAFLIIILIFCIFCYSYIFYCSYSRNEFVKQAIKISTENQNSVFRVNRILLYSSGNAIDNSSNQSLQDLGICQYTDIAISIDNTSYISDLNSTNTVKELYIDNINISTNLEDGFRYLNYKNLNNFGKFELLNTPENGRIDFNIITNNEENESADYSKPTFYTDCSNPISLGYINRDIVNHFSINEQVNSLVFNGKILQMANINLDDINYNLKFDIHIKNYNDDVFTYHASINGNLNYNNGEIYNNGYLYQTRNATSGNEYDFFKEVN